MHAVALIPQIFYEDVQVGVRLFRDGLGFRLVHEDVSGEQPFCILRRDLVRVHLRGDAELARGDRPQLRLAVDDIHALHREVMERAPALLHPNGRHVTLKPWGLHEFALRDATQVCVIVEQEA